MIRHAHNGPRLSMLVDDGYGNTTRITFDQLVTRIITGWYEWNEPTRAR